MEYPLENLNDETFQQFCQALLSRTFRDLQCFPVGQPDGGRDATTRGSTRNPLRFLVFQVKFVRDPSRVDDPRQWLLETLRAELPKVKSLIDRSAAGYYLLTNVRGSAHLDAGSIDKLNAEMSKTLEIESQCWWRDDILRRLDDAWDIKWAYPQIMTGPDFLRAIVESGVKQDSLRRGDVIQSFLRDQYERDARVKFRQVDLQNELLDLFVDVPLTRNRGMARALNKIAESDRTFSEVCAGIARDKRSVDSESGAANARRFFEHEVAAESRNVGAASFLLSARSADKYPTMVLEGGPGQGKSTISQYVCQVHRIRLLRIADKETKLRRSHANSPLRLPIKIDLRDFANWMSGGYPFGAATCTVQTTGNNLQLEPFISALISHHSGGQTFSVDDLISVLKVSSVLLVLDGLDEIAEIETRSLVIDEISTAVNRMLEIASSLRVVVTSRPAAFSNSPGMPESKFTYVGLGSLYRQGIDEYFDKWCAARQVATDVREELRAFIDSKLALPHIQELARNPMQLAILLSLLNSRGASLPDKRTALYDAYIDYFLDRESEKSLSVRTHRALIIDLHRYLGWVMHSESEGKGGRGSLPIMKVIELVERYLRSEGRDSQLATSLFQGIVERVFVLVSRAEGSIEFEVQPLREYFAARYLFETAPMSTTGCETSGARPDRFVAMAGNSHWLNVARFFAGCYSKGEIPSLIGTLEELHAHPELGLVSVPRVLAASLLRDWVFSQHPKSNAAVAKLVAGDEGFFRYIRPSYFDYESYIARAEYRFPPGCGRAEIVDLCLAWLDRSLPRVYQAAVTRVLETNSEESEDVRVKWLEHASSKEGADFDRWLTYGHQSGALRGTDLPSLERLPLRPCRLHASVLCSIGMAAYVESKADMFSEAVRALTEARGNLAVGGDSWLSVLGVALHSELFAFSLFRRDPTSARECFASMEIPVFSALSRMAESDTSDPRFIPFVRLAQTLERELARPMREWGTSLSPWRELVGALLEGWGEGRAVRVLALVSANVRAPGRLAQSFSGLSDKSVGLVERARFARLSAGNASYWMKQLGSVTDAEDRLFVLSAMIAFVPNGLLIEQASTLGQELDLLSPDDWQWLVRTPLSIRTIAAVGRPLRRREVELLPPSMSPRAAYLLSELADETASMRLIESHLAGHPFEDTLLNSAKLWWLLGGPNFAKRGWSPQLADVSSLFRQGAEIHRRLGRPQSGSRSPMSPSIDLEPVLRNPLAYPPELVQFAEADRRRRNTKKALRPMQIAERDRWFAQ